jgi:anti-anti-sigma factor
MISIGTELAAGRALVTVVGELDIATCPKLAVELARAIDLFPSEIVVDLGAVGFLDCRALSILLDARHRAALAHVRLRVVNANGLARQVLVLTRTAAELGLGDSAPRIAG